MHRELTVREILKSYAVMRLPRTFSVVAIERVVQDVIEALQVNDPFVSICTFRRLQAHRGMKIISP